MKRFIPIVTLAVALVAALPVAASELKSPDGNLVVTVETRDLGPDHAVPVYRITYKGRPVLLDSRLGLDLESAPLASDLEIAGEKRSEHDSTWKPVCGERSTVRDHYNELTLDLRETRGTHRQLRLTFRAYDEGVAFAYTVPEQPAVKDFVIAAERTQFHFAGDHPSWPVYRAQGDYAPGPVPLSQLKPGAERPLTVQVADDVYAAVTEARCVDYARMKLRPAADEPFTLEAFLDAERGPGEVTGTAPFATPWRVVMVSDSPGKLLEHDDLILNLNDPCAIADTAWIKPGKVIRETTLTTAGGKACVDFCVARGLQFIELDAGWYGKERDPKSDPTRVDPARAERLDLNEVIRYARDHGTGVILYVNGLALERQADELFPLYEKWGVKGVKFGFVNVGSQQWTKWVYDNVRKAADHHLMVDVHDEFRDTGARRTYPNLMTVEGIRGNEEFPSPTHNAALPFTRFLTGPGDYTYCWYSGKLKVTRAHQLALSTIYFSPWQFLFWYDKPAAYDGDPALDYWKNLPTCWDETRVLDGDIGKRASVARRRGNEWYVGTIDAQGGDVDLRLSFLEPGRKYQATVYSDRNPDDPASKAVKVVQVPVDSTTVLKIHLPANGGHAMRIVPATPN